MKFALLLLALFAFPAFAQTTPRPVRPAVASSVAPVAPRLEGDVSYVQNGVSTKVRFQWQAPDSVRIENERQTLVAQGDVTFVFNAATRRLEKLPFNIAREPWRSGDLGFGGPANVAIFGLNRESFERFYRMVPGETGALTFAARPEAARRVRDTILSGGEGNALYYLASTISVFDFPQTFKLEYKDGALTSREETRDSMVLRANVESDATSKLPVSAKAGDGEFRYELKPVAEPFAPETWTLPGGAKDAIAEDTQLKPLAQTTGNDAAAVLARGRIMALHLEDFKKAQELFEEASALSPRATAPHFLAYAAAFARGNLARAGRSLDALAALPGADAWEIQTRRAALARARRDWPATIAALEAAKKADPTDFASDNERAEILAARGDVAGGRALWQSVLANSAAGVEDQIVAAQSLVSTAVSTEENDAIRASLGANAADANAAGTSAASDFARALLDLRVGRAPEYGRIPASFKSALALAAARANRMDDAQTLASQSGVARTVAIIGALRGDASALKTFREALATLPGESARSDARAILFDAWRKAFRESELKQALDNRALSGAAGDDDLRTALAWQEGNGSLESVGATIRAGVARFPRSAWWHSRLADQLLSERRAIPRAQEAARVAAWREASEEIARAVELEPGQAFYAMHRAFILTQMATEKAFIKVPATTLLQRKNATQALDDLETAFPDDPDAMLSVALGRSALALKPSEDGIAAIQSALQAGTPDGDRHATVFFARQAMAIAWRTLFENPAAAAEQYEILLDAVASPGEEAGVAFNYLSMLQSATAPTEEEGAEAARNFEPQAALLERLARETWPLEAQNSLMSGAISLVLRDRSGAVPLAALLAGGNDARKLTGAQLQFEIERIFAAAASAADAPVAAGRDLETARAASKSATETLKQIGAGADKILAARALVLLAERAVNAGEWDEAARTLRLAIAIEPTEASLRVALANALMGAKKTDEAIATRDALVRELPSEAETLRLAASLSLRLNQAERAAELATQAQREAQLSPNYNAADVETATFVLARALWGGGKTAEAEANYRKLAGEQWNRADRAAALLDWSDALRAAKRDEEADRLKTQLEALQASEQELADADDLLSSL